MLHEQIRAYYLAQINSLPEYYQFHFSSRLFCWNQDTEARQILDNLYGSYCAGGDQAALVQILANMLDHPAQLPRANAAILREKYFAQYPLLRPYLSVLFRIRHWKHLYDIDMRDALYALIPKTKLLELQDKLLDDQESYAILSTYAINYTYLLQRFLFEVEDSVNVQALYDLRGKYNVADPTELQLLIYLYTHCIIAETLFYHRSLPEHNKTVYMHMIKDLEHLITEYYEQIHLDNKFEYLVCTKICEYTSTLEQRIWDEAKLSLSPEGTYLVDTLSKQKQDHKTDLIGSEHRNVLFIMSHTPFQPIV